jgi:hypothetical protein
MNRSIIGLTLAGALAAVMFSPALAQSVPQGSYQQTCTNVRVYGDRLEAQCSDDRGALVGTSIDLGSCRNGDIGNVNGNLRCFQRDQSERPDNRSFGSDGTPSGSYQQTCTNVRVFGDRLQAQCSNERGFLVDTSLDLGACRNGDIGNVDGNLRCFQRDQGARNDNRSFGNDGTPSGSYQQSCNNVSFVSGRLSATCSNPSGQPVNSYLDTVNCRPDSDITAPNGRLTCLSNAAAPTSALTLRTVRPENNAIVDGQRPAISAQFGQLQADPNTVRVRIDGRDVTNETSRSASGIALSPSFDLQSGPHTIRISGRDASGRPFDQAWQFTSNPAVLTNFIDNLQPSDNALVSRSIMVSGRTQPNAHLVVQLTVAGDQQFSINGVIGQLLGINQRPSGTRVETNADGNGYFSVQVNIDAGSGQQLGLVVDSTEPRSQTTARTSRTLVVQ